MSSAKYALSNALRNGEHVSISVCRLVVARAKSAVFRPLVRRQFRTTDAFGLPSNEKSVA